MRFNHAVDHEFHRARGEPVAGIFFTRILNGGNILRPQLRRILEIRNVEAERQIAVAKKFVIEIELFEVTSGAVNARQAIFIRPADTIPERCKFFTTSRLWNHRSNERLRRFFQCAGRLTGLRIANDDAVRGIRRVFCDMRECQRFRICPVGVAVVAFKEGRAVRENFIEIFFIRKRCGKHRIVPSAAENPIAPGMLAAIFAQTLLNVSGIF